MTFLLIILMPFAFDPSAEALLLVRLGSGISLTD